MVVPKVSRSTVVSQVLCVLCWVAALQPAVRRYARRCVSFIITFLYPIFLQSADLCLAHVIILLCVLVLLRKKGQCVCVCVCVRVCVYQAKRA